MAVKTLPAGSTPDTIEIARRALLQRRRFFRTCRLCGERNPLGWMMDDGMCQSCGESKLGVVF
jgi:rRNA maturation endonuclease Nob1